MEVPFKGKFRIVVEFLNYLDVIQDGIMNLNGRDYVFQKALGEAEW